MEKKKERKKGVRAGQQVKGQYRTPPPLDPSGTDGSARA